jgi:hypothetical protein
MRKSVYRKLGFLAIFAALSVSTALLSQCDDHINPVPQYLMKPTGHARDFIRFRYPLSASDSLQVKSHEEFGSSMGTYDIGFSITRSGAILHDTLLRKLHEMPRDEPDYANSFKTMATARACGSKGVIFFVTMQYQGDMTSPALLFLIVPTGDGYQVSTLPMLSGGVLEVSKSDPFHLRTWDNLHEGGCEACETAYEVTDYEVRDGTAVRLKKFKTRHMYTSGNARFNELRIRFVP